ncbi:MAG: hypothetical protein AAF939_03320 [Planctomycetota bacterium]
MRLIAFFIFASLAFSQTSWAQEKQDPTAASDVIKETLSKIRDVEKLDTFIEQNNVLKQENKKLKTDIAAIQKQLAELQKALKEQSEQLRRQLLQMPTFQVQSKVLGNGRNMATLKSKNSLFRIRTNTELSVPVSEGVWVLMQVKKISKDMIELYFPELERTVYLYD